MYSDSKAQLRNEMTVALLKDKILRLDFFRKLCSLSEINVGQIAKNHEQLRILENHLNSYKKIMNESKSSPEWLKNVEAVIENTKKEGKLVSSDTLDKDIEAFNSAIKATHNPEPQVL